MTTIQLPTHATGKSMVGQFFDSTFHTYASFIPGQKHLQTLTLIISCNGIEKIHTTATKRTRKMHTTAAKRKFCKNKLRQTAT